MSLSDVIRNITKTVTDKDEIKGRARDLPLLVVQGTLSIAGQALLFVDRVKNSIKGLASKEEEEKQEGHDSRPQAADAVAVEEDKPARREPVIFAPRPEAASPNGTSKTKPDPVIFTPAAKPDPEPQPAAPKAETPAPAPTPEAKTEAPAAAKAPAAAPEPTVAKEPTAAPEPVVGAEPVAATVEPALAPEPAVAEPVTITKPAAEKPKAKPRAARTKAPKADKLAEAVEATPAKEAPAEEVAPAVATPVKETALAEPMPGYSELTVASLRARMRGKSAEQIGACLAYEQATTARPEVVRMYENRLAKLQAGE